MGAAEADVRRSTRRRTVPPGESVFVFTPLNHLIARGLVYRALLHDHGRAVLRRRFSRSDWWADVRAHGCTEAILPAASAHWLLAARPSDDDTRNPLRRVIITPLIPQAREFEARFDVPVSISFGSTECGIPIASRTLPPDLRSCGRAVAGVALQIVTPGTDIAVPDGEVGELLVRSEPDKVSVGRLGGALPRRADGWIATGDLLRRDGGGWYFFEGRLHDVIRRRGENISPTPIEDAAIRDPDVLLAVAVPVPSEVGEDDIKLFVQPRPGRQIGLDRLAGRLEGDLPRFMVPRYLESRVDLPMTPTGKIRRAQLRSEAAVGPSTLDRGVSRAGGH
ncbi:AMP-binding protein [Pseudonocardia sp. EC080619-01]|uniref:AMP-binding protein n=1 Tax=Pseudonocardia sp. EC080619-01 TaxID=1096856 RepID=UPI002100B03B|nr:AMP-binding protein [Pseudonocardia sp. EC080619-01]